MRSKRKARLLLVLAGGVAAVLAAASLPPWAGDATLGVRATDGRGKPVVGAQVQLLHQALNSGPPLLTTNVDGRLEVGALAAGNWRIEVSKPGHMTYSGLVELRSGKKPKELLASLEVTDDGGGSLRVKLYRARAQGFSWAGWEEKKEDVAPSPPAPVKAEPEPAPEPEPEVEPEAPVTAAVASVVAGDLGEGDSAKGVVVEEPEVAEPVATVLPEAVVEAEPEVRDPVVVTPEPEPPAVESASGSESESIPEPEPEPAPAPKPDVTLEPDPKPPEPAAAVPPEAVADPVPAVAEPVAVAAPEPDLLPEGSGSKSGSKSKSESIPDPEPQPASVPTPEPDPPPVVPVPAAEVAPEPIPEPTVEPAPVSVPRAEPVAPLSLRGLGAGMRSSSRGNCPDCPPGEWAVTDELRLDPGVAVAEGCGKGLQQRMEELAGLLGDRLGKKQAVARFELVSPDRVGGLLDQPEGCGLLAVVLPEGARFRGYRYEVGDENGDGHCLSHHSCSIGECRWMGDPQVVRTAEATVVYGLFLNESQSQSRWARLHVYVGSGGRR